MNVQNIFPQFVQLCCTMLQLIMLISKGSNGTTLGTSVYGHCLFCELLGTIFLRQKSDFLPCISETRHDVHLHFQSSVKLVFFELPIVGKNEKMGTFAP